MVTVQSYIPSLTTRLFHIKMVDSYPSFSSEESVCSMLPVTYCKHWLDLLCSLSSPQDSFQAAALCSPGSSLFSKLEISDPALRCHTQQAPGQEVQSKI